MRNISYSERGFRKCFINLSVRRHSMVLLVRFRVGTNHFKTTPTSDSGREFILCRSGLGIVGCMISNELWELSIYHFKYIVPGGRIDRILIWRLHWALIIVYYILYLLCIHNYTGNQKLSVWLLIVVRVWKFFPN